MKRTHAEHANVVTNTNRDEKKTEMSVLQVHKKLGHINARATVQIADSLGWTLTGNRTINCASCAAGKAKQKSLNKVKIPDPDDEKIGTELTWISLQSRKQTICPNHLIQIGKSYYLVLMYS